MKMRKMKIISRKDIIFFAVVLILILLFILWKVCYYNNSTYKAAADGEKTIINYANEIITCLDKGDAKRIKSFLSEKSIEYSSDSVDEDINNAIELLKDNIETYDVFQGANNMEKYRDGAPFYSGFSTTATIKTKNNKNYILSLDYLAVFEGKKDTEYIGIGCIGLFDMDKTDSKGSMVKILEIGYNDFE